MKMTALHVALRVLQLGAIAVVLVASTHTAFELDRFLMPKEIVLHVTAVVAGLLAIRSFSRISFTWVDMLLVVWLGVSVASAIFAANHWLAIRAVAVSASAVVIFWTARALRAAGLSRPLLGALACAVVLAAITSLLQAYGAETVFFSTNRSPGGTLGNRNFVAHVAAFGLPICAFIALRAKSVIGYLVASCGIAIVAASLVLTRSRAAWVACAAMIIIFFLAILLSAPLRRDGRIWRRLFGIAVPAVGAVAAALLIPNTLRWRSDNPYLESVTGVVNYEEGSGRGRLVQYERSLRMAATTPILGVGPGNWSVAYPAHAPNRDPSIDTSEGGMTFNPWPSSDWVAFVSERGFAAAIIILLVFVGIAASAIKRMNDPEDALPAATLLATVAAAVVTGMFDAVLLLALPAFIVWAAIGALWTESGTKPMRGVIVLVVIALALVGAIRSTSQVIAMEMYSTRTSMQLASQIDPGNYRLHLRLAQSGNQKQRCAHARAAHALYPTASAARGLSRACE